MNRSKIHSVFAFAALGATLSMSAANAAEPVALAEMPAAAPHDFTLHPEDLGPRRHEVYAKAGLLGVGLGYAYGLNERVTLRADFTTVGSITKDFDTEDMKYTGKLRHNMATIYADWFPFDSGFRLTAGLGFRDTSVKARVRTDGGGNVDIAGHKVPLESGDSVKAKVEYPTVAPYLGLGYGHNVGQHTKPGWGFIADAGVYYGKPSVSMNVSDSVMAKLNAGTGGRGQELVDKETDEIKDKIGKYKVFPALFVGVSYRF